MADEIKSVLFKVDIDTKASRQEVAALKKDIADLRKEEKKDVEESEASQARKQKAIKKTAEAIEIEADSIADLRKRNKELNAERNATSTATEAGRKKIQALNAELDKNNAKIKENVDAYTKQKIGIGDYGGALDKLVPGLGATANGIGAMTKAGLAFIATPLGAILAALSLVLIPLISYLKGTQDGIDTMDAASARLSATMDVLKDRVTGFGREIAESVKPSGALGKFLAFFVAANPIILSVVGSIEVLKRLFPDLTREIEEEADAAERLARSLQAVRREENDLILERAASRAEVRQLKLDAEDQNKTLQERIILLETAANIERALLARQLEAQKTRAAATLGLDFITDEEIERIRRFGLELSEVGFSESLEEDREAAIREFAKLFELQEQSAGIQTEIFVKEQSFRAQAAAEAAAAEKLRLERLEAQKEQDEIDRIKASINRDEEVANVEELYGQDGIITNIHKDFNKRLERETKDRLNKEKANERAAAAFQLKVESDKSRALIGFTQLVTKERSVARILLNTLFKQDAIKETAISTKAAAVNAYKALAGIPIVGPVLGGIAAAAVTLYGLSQIAGIAGIPIGFARGGITGTRINRSQGMAINRSNGDDVLITAKSNEVILNERQQRALGGDRTFKRLGVPGFIGGGITGAQETANIANIVDAEAIQQETKVVLIYQDFEAKQAEIEGINTRVNVVG